VCAGFALVPALSVLSPRSHLGQAAELFDLLRTEQLPELAKRRRGVVYASAPFSRSLAHRSYRSCEIVFSRLSAHGLTPGDVDGSADPYVVFSAPFAEKSVRTSSCRKVCVCGVRWCRCAMRDGTCADTESDLG
jgi:hypothetical protein